MKEVRIAYAKRKKIRAYKNCNIYKSKVLVFLLKLIKIYSGDRLFFSHVRVKVRRVISSVWPQTIEMTFMKLTKKKAKTQTD